MSTRRLLALALSTVLLAAGCSEGQITKTEGDVRIWLHESGFATSADAADLQGTMVYERDSRCMFLTRVENRHAVIWPSGTRIDEEDPVVLTSRGETIREGDLVSGEGGWHSFDRFEDLIPAECRTGADGVVVFNADSEIEVTRP
jgi:hypothetical protein